MTALRQRMIEDLHLRGYAERTGWRPPAAPHPSGQGGRRSNGPPPAGPPRAMNGAPPLKSGRFADKAKLGRCQLTVPTLYVH